MSWVRRLSWDLSPHSQQVAGAGPVFEEGKGPCAWAAQLEGSARVWGGGRCWRWEVRSLQLRTESGWKVGKPGPLPGREGSQMQNMS